MLVDTGYAMALRLPSKKITAATAPRTKPAADPSLTQSSQTLADTQASLAARGHASSRFWALDGRIGRVHYILATFAISFGVGVVWSVLIWTLGITSLTWALCAVAALLAAALTIVYNMRRLQDINQNKWLAFLLFVPVLNILLMLMLVVLPGTRGQNRYGLPPAPPSLGMQIAAAAMVTLVLAQGILGTIFQQQVINDIVAQNTVAQNTVAKTAVAHTDATPTPPADNQNAPTAEAALAPADEHLNTQTIVITGDQLATNAAQAVASAPTPIEANLAPPPTQNPMQDSIQNNLQANTPAALSASTSQERAANDPAPAIQEPRLMHPPTQTPSTAPKPNDTQNSMSYADFVRTSETPVFSEPGQKR